MLTITGFDLGKIFEWYSTLRFDQTLDVHLGFPKSNVAIPKKILNPNYVGLSDTDLGAAYYLFPNNARERSILRNVVGQPTSWLSKDSTPEAMVLTTDEKNAASPTSFIHAHTDYTPWQQTGVPSADIFLYELPASISNDFKKMILRHGFIHNFAHTVFQPAAYLDDYMLKFPDGKTMSGLDAIAEFTRLAEKHDPISQYSAVHRPEGREFKSSNLNYDTILALNEEFSECVAAYFMGFTFCDDRKGKDPFEDRPKVAKFITDFLDAKLV